MVLVAKLRICADGGANRLLDAVHDSASSREKIENDATYLPEMIIGDLDSLRPAVQDFYRGKGVQFVDLSHDQDSTDLEKCIKHADKALVERGLSMKDTTIIAAGFVICTV